MRRSLSEIRFTGTEPSRTHLTDAGYDLYAAHDIEVGMSPIKVPTGTSIQIPEGYVGIIKDRSSMAARGIHTSAGVIDAGYTGEIQVLMHSVGLPELVSYGQKIAQLIIVPCLTLPLVRAGKLEATIRGDGGFGSTGL